MPLIFEKLFRNKRSPAAFWREATSVPEGLPDSEKETTLTQIAKKCHPSVSVRVSRTPRDQLVLTFIGEGHDEGWEAALELSLQPPRQWSGRAVHEHTPLDWIRHYYESNIDLFERPQRPPLSWRPLVFYGGLALNRVSRAVTCHVVERSDLVGPWIESAEEVIRDSWRNLDAGKTEPETPLQTLNLVLAERLVGVMSDGRPRRDHPFPFDGIEESIDSSSTGAEIEAVALVWSLCGLLESTNIENSVSYLLRMKRDPKTRNERALARLALKGTPQANDFVPLLERVLSTWRDPVATNFSDADLHGDTLRHLLALCWCAFGPSGFSREAYVGALVGESS